MSDPVAASQAPAGERPLPIQELLQRISALPEDWHGAGTLGAGVLEAVARHAAKRVIRSSAETGSGRSTLLFSHLSPDHKVFAVEGDNRSISAVRASPLLRASTVQFVEGPTQRTLGQHPFREKLQLVLLDGPHGYPFPELEYYHLYPHLDVNGLLIVDDIQIPTVHHLFEFLREDEMFRLLQVVNTTAFFERTEAPLFNPSGDGWWLQNYNKKRHPIVPLQSPFRRFLARTLPGPVKRGVKRVLRM